MKFDTATLKEFAGKAVFVGGVAAFTAYSSGVHDVKVLLAAFCGAAASFIRNTVYKPAVAAVKAKRATKK